MSLKNEVALDTRLVVGDATQVIVEGAAQNLPREIQATQVSSSVISWNNILSIGENVLIDTNWFVEYQVAVTYNSAITNINSHGLVLPNVLANGTAIAPLYVAVAANTPNVAFAQYPLSRVTNSISLQFNNVETTVNEAILQNVSREFILDFQKRTDLASTCPSELYVSPNTPDQVAGLVNQQPNSPYWESRGKSRASVRCDGVVAVAGSAGFFVATYTLREPLFISPLSLHNQAALANIQSINLRINLDSSNGLQGMLKVPTIPGQAPPDKTQIFANILTASLYLDYLTVDVAKTGMLPKISYYNFEFPEFNQTPFTKLANTIGAVQTFSSTSTNSYKLTTMPKYYYCKVSPQVNGLSCANNMCGLPISQMTIQFGSFGLYTFVREQLWQCFKKNTGFLDMSYAQWVAVGTPIVLQPAVDITSANEIFVGKMGDSGIMFQNSIQCTNENYANSGLTNYTDIGAPVNAWFIYEVFVNSGSCQIGEGTCVFKNSTMTESEFVAATQDDLVSADAVKASQGAEGGSFLSSLKGVIHSARHVVRTGARALQHPMVQAGLSALSGGSIRHGRGRPRK